MHWAAVLKVVAFNSAQHELEEERNLRVGRHGLTLCSMDAAWHPLESCANEIATAANNGSVVWWDLTMAADNKQRHIIKARAAGGGVSTQKRKKRLTEQPCVQAHPRTATCVVFHPTEAAVLLSGSQDMTVKKWDTRSLAAAAAEFQTKECVRSIRCNPHLPSQFAVALESGNIQVPAGPLPLFRAGSPPHVQVWDMRMPGVCEQKIQAHQGPVYTVAWHPTRRNVLASAGRDKIIRVWDVGGGSKDNLRQSVQTIASVARVLWRPSHPDHVRFRAAAAVARAEGKRGAAVAAAVTQPRRSGTDHELFAGARPADPRVGSPPRASARAFF